MLGPRRGLRDFCRWWDGKEGDRMVEVCMEYVHAEDPESGVCRVVGGVKVK